VRTLIFNRDVCCSVLQSSVNLPHRTGPGYDNYWLPSWDLDRPRILLWSSHSFGAWAWHAASCTYAWAQIEYTVGWLILLCLDVFETKGKKFPPEKNWRRVETSIFRRLSFFLFLCQITHKVAYRRETNHILWRHVGFLWLFVPCCKHTTIQRSKISLFINISKTNSKNSQKNGVSFFRFA